MWIINESFTSFCRGSISEKRSPTTATAAQHSSGSVLGSRVFIRHHPEPHIKQSSSGVLYLIENTFFSTKSNTVLYNTQINNKCLDMCGFSVNGEKVGKGGRKVYYGGIVFISLLSLP